MRKTQPTTTPADWEDPQWNVADRVHNWRNYISEEVRAMWPTLPDEVKRALARQADAIALNERWS